MNTPEPFSKTRNSNSRPQGFYPPVPGQPVETNPTFPSQSQMAQNQGHPPQQNASWQPVTPNTGTFQPRTPLSTPSMPGMATFQGQAPQWNKPVGAPLTNNFPSSTPFTPPIPSPKITTNLNGAQVGGHNSGYLPPANPFATSAMSSPPTTNNQWANGVGTANRTGGPGGFSPPNTPTPHNNTSLNAKPPRRRNTNTVGKILLFLGLALLVATAGVTGFYLFQGSSTGAGSTAKKAAVATPKPTPTPTPTVHMQHQQLATQYVANMSLNDEIAQLLMVEHYDDTYSPDLDVMINQQHVGAVIYYANAIVTHDQIAGNISSMQQRAKIPVFTAIDEEGWNVGRMGALYPNYYSYRLDADTMGLSGDPNVASQQGQRTAKDMLSIGMNMNLAPDVDVSNDNDYIGYDRRSFGPTTDTVIKYAGPYLKALQTNGVVGTIKHFPGLGSILKGFDPHAVLPIYTGTKDQLYQTDIVPFQHFISDADQYEQAHVVMPTDMLVPAIDPTYPAELSHTFITDILRNQMGFKGVILTDSLHMEGVLVNGQKLSLADTSVLALQAGNDMLEGASTSDQAQSIINAVNAAVQSGKLSKAQIDASVIRVLTLKMDFNIMPATLK